MFFCWSRYSSVYFTFPVRLRAHLISRPFYYKAIDLDKTEKDIRHTAAFRRKSMDSMDPRVDSCAFVDFLLQWNFPKYEVHMICINSDFRRKSMDSSHPDSRPYKRCKWEVSRHIRIGRENVLRVCSRHIWNSEWTSGWI